MKKILIIEDDFDICHLLEKFLQQNGFETETANTAKKALMLIEKFTFDLVLSDYKLEGMDGRTLMNKIKEIQSIPVIIITGHNDTKAAVDSIRSGAYDYILKPLLPQEILNTIQQALNEPVNEAVTSAQNQEGITNSAIANSAAKQSPLFKEGNYLVGKSAEFTLIMHQIMLVAPTNYSVIIYGESGTGKEAIAQEIHKRSERKNYPFVPIDCGALSKELAGSELFGHEKGSFTGALNAKTGSFEMANKGTIFLDEIANLPYSIQVSLLRVLQERKIRKVGSTKDIDIDVRIIIASNEKLWDKTRDGSFREDLYHRFNEFSIEVPPLRKRKEDIPLFSQYFLDMANQLLNKSIEGFQPACMEALVQYQWPGNLRELKNVIKRAALLTDGNMVELKSIPLEITHQDQLKFDTENFYHQPMVDETIKKIRPTITSLKISAIDYEYELIQKTLRENNFNKTKTAKLLNIDRKTLYNKIAIYQELVQKNEPENE